MRHGGRFALSDDSHGPHAVGLNYHRLADFLHRLQITEVYYLESSPSLSLNAAGRRIRSCRLVGNWWEHRFWKNTKPAAA